MEEDPNPLPLTVPRSYLGKAGEWLVAGKLLLNGFNVFPGAIDDGIDLLACKDDQYYKIQVKTCQDLDGYDGGSFMARVNLSTLTRHDRTATFVVLVVHYLPTTISTDFAGNHSHYDQDFIVIPVPKLLELVGQDSGEAVIRIKSGIFEEPGEHNFLYKAQYRGNELFLDNFLIESFDQIVSKGA